MAVCYFKGVDALHWKLDALHYAVLPLHVKVRVVQDPFLQYQVAKMYVYAHQGAKQSPFDLSTYFQCVAFKTVRGANTQAGIQYYQNVVRNSLYARFVYAAGTLQRSKVANVRFPGLNNPTLTLMFAQALALCNSYDAIEAHQMLCDLITLHGYVDVIEEYVTHCGDFNCFWIANVFRTAVCCLPAEVIDMIAANMLITSTTHGSELEHVYRYCVFPLGSLKEYLLSFSELEDVDDQEHSEVLYAIPMFDNLLHCELTRSWARPYLKKIVRKRLQYPLSPHVSAESLKRARALMK